MKEEKGRRRKERENDSEGRSRRGRKGRRSGRRYASGLKPPTKKNSGYVPAKSHTDKKSAEDVATLKVLHKYWKKLAESHTC